MWREEKYLLKTIIKTIAAKGKGSKEKLPILYHPLTPLISFPKNKSPKRVNKLKKYKLKTRYEFVFKNLKSKKLRKIKRAIEIAKKIICFLKIKKSEEREEL